MTSFKNIFAGLFYIAAGLFLTLYVFSIMSTQVSAGQQTKKTEKNKMNEKIGLQTGIVAPDFKLPDQDGRLVTLNDFLGEKIVVLYFYPKDFTKGCTLEACAFRDSYDVFKTAGAEVIGVSSDSMESHKKFIAEYHLPFTLLSDTDSAVRKLYGVKPNFGLIPGRVTFVIDTAGIIRNIFSSQTEAEKHIKEALKVIEELKSKPKQ